MAKKKAAKKSKLSIRPLDDRLVVKPAEAESVSAGGILLPDSASEKPTRGEVVEVGPGRMNKNGDRIPMAVAVGDVVLYGSYAGSDVKVGGEEFKIMRESDLLAKIEE